MKYLLLTLLLITGCSSKEPKLTHLNREEIKEVQKCPKKMPPGDYVAFFGDAGIILYISKTSKYRCEVR
jgi:hypothetical protein